MLKIRIEENLKKLSGLFEFQQYRIKKLSLEYSRILQKKIYETHRTKRPVEDLDYTPERSLDLLILQEIDVRYDVLMTRLKIYEILMKLLGITHVSHLSELFADFQNSCQNLSVAPIVPGSP